MQFSVELFIPNGNVLDEYSNHFVNRIILIVSQDIHTYFEKSTAIKCLDWF